MLKFVAIAVTVISLAAPAAAQVPPSAAQIGEYDGLLKASHEGDLPTLKQVLADGADLGVRDDYGRTAVHIAAFASHEAVINALATTGADMNGLENDAYDAVTIAAVANDVPMLQAAIAAGNRAGNVTSRYDGTALIAAAHLGHHQVVRVLIEAGAPLDHINNLGWTALIEAVVLGDGGPDHQQCVRYLLDAGADKSITDRQGATSLELAQSRGYEEIVKLLGD